ncbi:pyridoxamine 5'-phosphate oxidase family protein, partial [Vibrio parahaemolyticus]|uniref:pyridoxamine 5'-phosphate oxidase family protein n=1 Tax=Vibrio parahaemolyticus TaxID=670 RepID=UPI00146AD037|nr:pyridoxamine 5'-phosphate oxidase family protein [Vibrio parahaemolyticus]
MIAKLSEEEAQELLQRNELGRLGCIVDDRPYVVPVNYLYDGDSVYIHSLPGR